MQPVRLMHLGADDPAQPLVAPQAEDVIDAVVFAPGHQRFTAEPGLGPQHDLYLRPTPTQLRNDAACFLNRTRGRILVGRTEPCTEQLVAGEDIQRQITVAVVVAMEEPLRLMAGQRDVGRIQIKHHLAGHDGMRLDVEVYQQPVNGLSRVTDLVITLAAPSQFQPVQRTLARQWLFQLPLTAQQPQQRIGAQLLVIVQILVAKRQPVNPLSKHLRQLVLDQVLVAAIAKTARQTAQKVDPPLDFTQQQRTAVARHLPSCEPGFNPAR